MSDTAEETAIAQPKETAKGISDIVRRKRSVLLKLLAYSGLIGIISALFPNTKGVLDYLFGLPALVLGITWCHLDANQREYSLGKLMRLGLIFMFVIVFPFYLFRTRGLKGITTLAQAILFVIAMFACTLATAFANLYARYLVGARDLDL